MNDLISVTSPFAAQDMAQIKTSLEGIDLTASKVSKNLTTAFSSAATSGKTFEQTLQSIGLNLTKLALNAGMRPLQSQMSSMLGSFMSNLTSSVTPFAEGGIVSRPTYFYSSSGAGLMGERGAEAILPLSRGSDGRLGLAVQPSAAASSIVVNISTPDADSFKKSQVQLTGALARAVMRGQRGV
ncbi:MAG: phage tail tape measure protein [Alphaproteobacteria bacterium]|nr:phage tail tape measure protein [Alphaproteobacteria bacterium]